MKVGTVYLVGAGPGDPKLLTIKGQEALRLADVVVYDHLVSPRVLKLCAPHAKPVYVGKEASRHTMDQAFMNALLIREARAGRTVVRLKGGDPFVFGRGGEEALALAKAKIPFEIVPGVTSAIAAPAYAGIPVTHRQLASSLAIVTGHEDPTKDASAIHWKELATACDTLVFMMGVGTLRGIATQLLRHGRDPKTPCAIISRGTWPTQRTVTGTLRTIVFEARRAAVKPPAVIVVGQVVSLRRTINWFERKPLFGRRILVTRASDKAASLTDQLEALGAQVEELPAIELAAAPSNGAFRRVIRDAAKPDWVFFTSPEGIGWFSRMLKPYRTDIRWLSGCHIGAIGPKTALAIEAAGLHVDFVPSAFSQEGMLRDFPSRVLKGKRALILSAQGSRDALEAGLRRRGMRVTKVAIYRTVMPSALIKDVDLLFRDRLDAVTATSASCVEHLAEALRAIGPAKQAHRRRGGLFRRLPFASIGPITSRAVWARGGRVIVEAQVSTIEGLVKALVRKLQ